MCHRHVHHLFLVCAITAVALKVAQLQVPSTASKNSSLRTVWNLKTQIREKRINTGISRKIFLFCQSRVYTGGGGGWPLKAWRIGSWGRCNQPPLPPAPPLSPCKNKYRYKSLLFRSKKLWIITSAFCMKRLQIVALSCEQVTKSNFSCKKSYELLLLHTKKLQIIMVVFEKGYNKINLFLLK